MSKKHRRKEAPAELAARLALINEPLLDFERMKNRCVMSVEDYRAWFKQMPNATLTNTKDGMLVHLDRGGSILGVAHLDATGQRPHFGTVEIDNEWWVFTRWVDDRLGAFLLLDVLPRLGLRYDMLFTVGEEKALSTAYFFETEKKYRWMFELDRAEGWGKTAQAVYYQYRTEPLVKALKAAGIENVEHGAYTDIVELEHLGVCGFNLAIGYVDNHDTWARANLAMTAVQVEKLWRFFTENEETVFPFDPNAAFGRRRRGVTAVYIPPSVPNENWKTWKEGGGNNGYRPPLMLLADDLLRDKQTKTLYRVETISNAVWNKGANSWGYWCHWFELVQGGFTIKSGYKYTHEFDLLRGSDWKAARDEWEAATGELIHSRRMENDPFDSFEDWTQPNKVVSRTHGVDHIDPAEYNAVSRACDGLPHLPETKIARLTWERWYWDRVSSFSYSQPKDAALARFKCGDEVHTPYGRAHIDCYYPVVPWNDAPRWWIRFTRADKGGHYTDLIPDAELTPVVLSVQEVPHDPTSPAA